MMNIMVKIHELNAEDPLAENSRAPLTLQVSPDSTFEDLKLKIEEEEEYEPEEQQLLFGFCPVELKMKLKEAVEDGDTITAVISREKTNEVLTASNLSSETLFMIIGPREKFDIIPFKHETRVFTNSIFKKILKFGIVTQTRGEDGERIFTCNVYEVHDGTKVEIRGTLPEVQIFEYFGTLPVEAQVKKQKVYKESELIKGFLSQNLKDALTVFSTVIEAVGGITKAVGGAS